MTHSPTIALALMRHVSIEVILLGGRLFRHSVVAVGAACLEGISRVQADLFFMGVTGIHPQTGFTTGDFEEAGVKRAMSRAAAETFVLASAEKLGAASPYLVTDLDGVTGLITEKSVDDAELQPYLASGLTVIRA